MTILQVTKDVCATVGVKIPQSLFSGITSDRTMQEMLTFANEMAQRIAYDYRDWTTLRTTQTYTGDGTTTAWDLPADYKRMLLTANVWRSTSTMTPMVFVPDTDEWLNRRARATADNAFGEWTMLGGQMHIVPALGVGQTAYFPYLGKNCVNLGSGGRSDAFLADNDTFALDERLLKLGMVWQWKQNKGASYAEEMGSYGDAMAVAMGHDSPSPIIIGHRPISVNARIAYPWPVPT